MRKIIIHIEEIKSYSEKIQFQIKLPVTACQVTGVLVTVNPNTEFIRVEGDPRIENTGSLWLRISENRDVFFADDVKESNHQESEFHNVLQQGIASEPDWWFSGQKREFFSITVPIEDAVIEGFYIDETPLTEVNYLLKIYLELELND